MEAWSENKRALSIYNSVGYKFHEETESSIGSFFMTKMQMSFIVERYGKKDNVEELKEFLNDGWLVAMI